MKLGLVTKPDKRNKTKSKKTEDDVMSGNCDVIAIFPIYSQFGAIRKPDSGRIVYKTYRVPLIVTFYLTKTENKTKISLTQLLHYCLELRYYFGQERLIFCKEMLTSTKLRRP